MEHHPIIIIGAGPAGLTAAYESVRRGIRPIVLEKADKVGGLARTETHKGFRFDIGGHRFFTKVEAVQQLWRRMLGEDFPKIPRLSRIHYRGRFFHYPLDLFNALSNLGPIESLWILLSYLRAQVWPMLEEETFEQWVSNRFGRRLYQTFFQTYTEKVWGIPCNRIQADWAAQRIRGLSLARAVLNALFGTNHVRTLINEFHYPVLGPGMMWQRFQEAVEAHGGQVQLGTEVISFQREGHRIKEITARRGDKIIGLTGDHVISSMPVTQLILRFHPPPPAEVVEAARQLTYRAFILVGLIVDRADLFPDQWIYVHSPRVRVGRIQNFKNWSPAMVPDPRKTSLGMEYFCSEGDEVWEMTDADLLDMARCELASLGLADLGDVEDGIVIRQPNAYPVYDRGYGEQLEVIQRFLGRVDNLQTIGRNGLHRYNNQDHSMLTGMLAVRNLMLGEKHDLWNVNTDQEYQEEIRDKPEVQDAAEVLQATLARIFPKLDRVAFGLSLGAAAGIFLFLATLWFVLKGGEVVGPHLQLLSQYFPGYSVTLSGSVLGLVYGFATGFLGGWGFAILRNATVFVSMAFIHRRAEVYRLRNLLDYV